MPRRTTPHTAPRSAAGGRHELGQNFLHHPPTVRRFADLVRETDGAILELGAGDGALTRELARLGRPLTAVEIDEHRVERLRRMLRRSGTATTADPRTTTGTGTGTGTATVRIEHDDAMRVPLDAPVVAGNIPFHLTSPLLRRLLTAGRWQHAVLLTQWEVARKRAGVGGGTMMTAQGAPWFEVRIEFRVPARHFRPVPGVDGGVLSIVRRPRPLVPVSQRRGYEAFVRAVFTGRGGRIARVVERAARVDRRAAERALARAGVDGRALPRDVGPEQWASLWHDLRG
ncbi:23S ribosomal RNA methyltransferase Erm [Georgenia sp. Z1344]|uniref:23S ribosomal RNA methyltransferase Erm n=1 Tax=Georgenia sp. Z1344 TaxID=3416706 RepID=UPI003CFB2F99